jgi:tight adherence protein C
VLAVGAGAVFLPVRDLERQVRERRISIQMDFPDFLMKMTLLINAGMTISRAWEKVSLGQRNTNPLYMELEMSIREIRGGCSEYTAYENFARRCRIPVVTRSMSVLMQNLRKGNSELVSIMRILSAECWDNRKNAAKRLGEEAATKMLFPLVLMFISVLLIVATPAVLALKGL